MNLALVESLLEYSHNPLGFVLTAFPWGEKDSPLEHAEGPDTWQTEVLIDIGDKLKAGKELGAIIQEAVSSGHGVGKSTLVAWIILWAMSTYPDTRGVVTANTENQLRTKTWAELAKWYHLCISKELFIFTATAIYSTDEEHEKTWRIDMVPWSDRNTEAFAGLHNQGKRVLLIFDEGSAIPDVIWEVSEGALTDKGTEIIWCTFGNPTRNTGRFKACFSSQRHRWNTWKVDSRTVKITNKEKLQEWIDDYGIDSDFVRVRIRGEFPKAGSTQFISTKMVEDAMDRTNEVPVGTPKLFGVDVARFGDDQTVIVRRHGRKVEEVHKFRGLDTMETASKVAELILLYRPNAVYVDEIGIGAGVVDRLKQLGFEIIPVVSSRKADDDRQYYNKRGEMWGRMKEWMDTGDIPYDTDMVEDLTGIEYGYDNKMRIKLEKKAEMKKRGLASPDIGDALALTFAYPAPVLRRFDYNDLVPEYFEDF